MKLEKIKDTTIWKQLANNPKFEEEFEKVLKRCYYYVQPDELKIDVSKEGIILSYNSEINNRDLDSQFKMFNGFEFLLDNDNLIINEVSGRLESNYGYDFKNTDGGKLITHYSCQSYDENGIELSYQSYVDKYIIDKKTFNKYQKKLSDVINGMYNPSLFNVLDGAIEYPKPSVIGDDAIFLRKNRSKNNLGIVEVFKGTLGKDNTILSNKEYYFNTFFDGVGTDYPELIHIMNGLPFATISERKIKIKDEYAKLGLTDDNYPEIARERFLKELMEYKEKQVVKNPAVLDKYDLMIEQLENKRTKEKGIH